MAIGGVSGLFGLIFMPLGSLLLYLSYPLLLYFERIVNLFGQIESKISIQEFSWPLIVGYYSMLSAGVLFFGRKSKNKK